jgi:ATP-dependent DNA helicase RecG
MSSNLPINLSDLLHRRTVESARVEFKASWDEKATGAQVIRTICAFANDFQNLNGGYIVIGVGEHNGVVELPPKGLAEDKLESIQKWIRGHCNKIDPNYQPLLSPETFDDRHILVIWAPASDNRPHKAPESNEKPDRKYYIRLGPETVDADRYSDLKAQLMQMTARVPYDDRRALHASVLDIRETKVREFLQDIRSELVHEPDTQTLYRNLRIAVQVNGYDAPKNIGLLFFSQDPEQWFPGARIEVVHFSGDAAGNILEEKIFSKRPIHEQLRECLAYLENLSVRQLEKLPNRTQAATWVSYPSQALRESLVNAVYHRSYEGNLEPIKVYLYPDRLEIISYPGPVPGIEQRHLDGDSPLPPVPARNRRIGEFLKELKLAEGRGTGIPKLRRVMEQNGSAPPRFDFDEARSYFRTTLPAHPEYLSILALQDVARLKAIGDNRGALARLKKTFERSPASMGLATELARELIRDGDLPAAIQVFERFVHTNPTANPASLITLIASAYLDAGSRREAMEWLDRVHIVDAVENGIDAAIQEKRAGRLERAHRHFSEVGEAISRDVKALHEFAQVKMKLAGRAKRSGNHAANRRLLAEAREMLARVVQMDAPPIRKAWAWHDFGRVLQWLKAPHSEIRRAFSEALRLYPDEPRFQESLKRLDTEMGANPHTR